MRIILYTGKGGVGKTTISAASACKIAKSGKRVLIMSTDQAHSLSDSFDIKLGKEPKNISNNLDGMEIDTVYEGERNWKNLKGYIKRLITLKGEKSIEVEELLIFPGLEELFALFKILEVYNENKYDVLIVDCAPTGETLSLLKYPEQLSNIIEKVLPMKRKMVKTIGPAFEKVTKVPMPEDNVFDDIEYVINKMKALQSLMLNKDILSIRIVTTPERIVIKESKRNFTCLHLYNYNVDALIINKIYPEKAMEGYFNKWILMQEEGLKEIEESFSEIPKYYLELQRGEIITVKVLQKIGDIVFNDDDITKVLFNKEIFTLQKNDDKTTMKILLPFAEKEELDLHQEKDEIILSVKNQTRRFPLPVDLQDKDISKAKYDDEYLYISF